MSNIEPMELDGIESEFDNKENTYHINNALLRPSCEKENENLVISEVNTKLQYSITQEFTPMSKSFTANYTDGENISSVEDQNIMNINSLTQSLNLTLNNSDSNMKSPKSLPLQSISDQYTDIDRHSSVRRSFDAPKVKRIEAEIDRLPFQSASSSLAHTPEETTPTKEIPKDGGSPIMRGLKSVLSMFRSSKSPILPLEVNSLEENETKSLSSQIPEPASQPVVTESARIRNNNIKSISPVKESIVFQDDLERELQWTEDFKDEKVPIHILFPSVTSSNVKSSDSNLRPDNRNMSSEYMDISLNDTVTGLINHQTSTELIVKNHDSDSEFVDCESTYNNYEICTNNESKAYQEDINMSVVEYNTEVISSSTEQQLYKQPNKTVLFEPQNVSISNSADITDNIMNVSLRVTSDVNEDVTNTEDAISTTLPLDYPDDDNVNEVIVDNTLDSIEAKSMSIPVNIQCSNTEYDLKTKNIMDGSTETLNLNKPINIDVEMDIKEYVEPEKDENVHEAIVENTLDNVEALSMSIPVNIQCLNTKHDLKTENMDGSTETLNLHKTINIDVEMDTKEYLEPEKGENANEAIVENTFDNDEASSMSMPVNIQCLNTKHDLKTENMDGSTETLNLNKTININVKMDAKEYLEPDKDENVHEAIVENTFDNDEALSMSMPVNIQCLNSDYDLKTVINIEQSIENNTFNDNYDNVAVDKTIDVEIATGMETKNVLNVDIKETTVIVESDQPESIQVRVSEARMDESNYLEANNQIHNSENPNDSTFTDFTEFTTETIKNINKEEESALKSVLPDFVQLSQDPEITCHKENEISYQKYDTAQHYQNDIACVNLSKIVEETTISYDTSATELGKLHDTNINTLKDTTTTNEALNNHIIQDFDQVNTIESVNETHCCQNEKTFANESKAVKSSINFLSNDMRPNKNVIDLNHVALSDVQDSSLNSETVECKIEPNVVSVSEENVCLESNILMNNKDNSLAKDEPNLNVNNKQHTFIEQAHYKVSAQLLNYVDEDSGVQVGKEVLLNHNQLKSSLTDTSEVDLKSSDSKIEITDENVKTCKGIIKQEYTENAVELQTDIYKTYKLDINDLELENINNSLASEIVDLSAKSRLLETPPVPQNTTLKGYNFNFDEIEDPFATRTNIRSSPLLNNAPTSNLTSVEVPNIPSNQKKMLLNRRKSQMIQKKQIASSKKKMNTTYDEKFLDTKDSNNLESNLESNLIECDEKYETQILTENHSENAKEDTDTDIKNDKLNVPHKDNQRNVFNLPEINDRNFNPFANRIKVCLTPPLVNKSIQENDYEFDSNKNNVTLVCQTKISEEITDECNDSNSSKSMDKTVTGVNTEDEDTIEGPFLDAVALGDFENNDVLNDAKHEYVTFDSDIKHDYMDFSDYPKEQANGAENEMFIDAEAFEFLLNQNQPNVVANSGKESLFLKFDPLFAKIISSDGILASLGKIQKNQVTQMEDNQPESNFPENTNTIPSCSNNSQSFDNIDESNNNNLGKPTVVVKTAVVAPRKPTTPIKTNRKSLTVTSPAMAVIDRLLCLSLNHSSSSCHDASLPQSCSEHNNTDTALAQLREMLAQTEMRVQASNTEREELISRLGTLESQVKTLEYESEARLKNIKDLNCQITEKNEQNKNMAAVVAKFEQTIVTLFSDIEQDRKRYSEERMQILKDRDEQTAHLLSMEISFNDLHSKYEKSKQIIFGLKTNEHSLKKSLQGFEDSLLKSENNYELLKQHAMSQLNQANQELEKINKAHEVEVLKLKAMIKRKDLHISSLEERLAQKAKANEELTAICDELIYKVG